MSLNGVSDGEESIRTPTRLETYIGAFIAIVGVGCMSFLGEYLCGRDPNSVGDSKMRIEVFLNKSYHNMENLVRKGVNWWETSPLLNDTPRPVRTQAERFADNQSIFPDGMTTPKEMFEAARFRELYGRGYVGDNSLLEDTNSVQTVEETLEDFGLDHPMFYK